MNTALPCENRMAVVNRVSARISILLFSSLFPFCIGLCICTEPKENGNYSSFTVTENNNNRLFQPFNRMIIPNMNGESRLLESSKRK